MSEPTWEDFELHLKARATQDKAFRAELLKNPAYAINQEMAAAGLDSQIPDDIEVVLLEETPGKIFITLPSADIGADVELSEEALEAVAGGKTPLSWPCPECGGMKQGNKQGAKPGNSLGKVFGKTAPIIKPGGMGMRR